MNKSFSALSRKSGKLRLQRIAGTLLVISVLFTYSMKAAMADTLTPDQFGSLLTLNEAVTRALKTAQEVKCALARLHKEESLYKGVVAEFFPKLNGEVFSAFATGDKQFVGFLDAGIEQPIFQGGKIIAEKRKQKTVVGREQIKLEQAKLDVELVVRILYVRVLEEKELIRIAQAEVKELSVEYDRIKKLVFEEKLTRSAFFRIQTLFQGAKHNLVKHKERYDYLFEVLKETVGISEGESLDIEPAGDFPEIPDSVSAYLTASREHDPLYKLKDLRVEEKQFEKRALQADRFPHLSVAAKWNRLDDVFADTNRAMLGLVGKWDIWDFGRLGSKIKAKSDEIEETKWEGDLLVREHERQLRETFHDARAMREKIRSVEAVVEERQEIYKNEKTKLITGENGSAELIDSFQALEEAKIEKLETVSDYRVLLANLERKTGFDTFANASLEQGQSAQFTGGEAVK
ncbi:MAG: hypothetical protein A3G33_08245 [Omnitrophica bacterium RIFCSPLOWO2_12_FULL_44_17]|uniref:Outer membrane efflux protein n=1 Tax=Candidatus Danuiimicrobium aquiferis TaxID=1801832 RepID=A0A1G1KVZ8_9BACT|nr:MAG: hypothetical protein A3B72_03460 [Omnitrophica bacterium RIFCSPHIGHO2_02_FULL_45_28]OGW92612.1 MAG: hypothetical protein A3E74_02490 [Omnitrophica bacterium RIFCSPHIGHO2_12_FULL_44_12]OGW97154.1 MAG: hypothetical protein A3G33_08245 [Omnitrophica bacterium RIFCSPLOWO2_12_FULL_44_17]OGX02214.1 MAG: hypothetical protein A3J12_08020 [Omnitrophica bacterium RIFCSPLOWO2_02_FULL_44_11]